MIHADSQTYGSVLIVSDTGNNRIVIVSEQSYECVTTIGAGTRGDEDGSFDEAKLYHPQGLVLTQYQGEEAILSCDAKNHKIKVAKLKSRVVKTVAGTGV